VNTSNSNRPLRMFQEDRGIDNNFEPEELLYRRFCPHEILGDRLAPDSIKFPDWSVNREKYSEPHDVQFPSGSNQVYLCCGIAGFSVADIPCKVDTQGIFTFNIEHNPKFDNYAHSELITYKNGVSGKELKNFKVSNTIKKTFRQLLSDKSRIISEPSSTGNCINSKQIIN